MRLRPEHRRIDPADRLVWQPGDAAQCDLWFPPRVVLVKLVASAVPIGSGGSAGREGPTAQISAGSGRCCPGG